MGRHAILCIDNAPSHIFDDSKFTNTKVVFLVPNMTSHIQPMDAGIIRAFKAHYRQLYILRALERFEDGCDNIYAIDQLEGMNIANEAWTYVTSKTVANCWKHAGILEPEKGPSEAVSGASPSTQLAVDSGVQEAVNALQSTLTNLAGQHVATANLPTAEELLNIAGEMVTEEVWSDNDIIEQVQLNAREESGEHVIELDEDPEPAPVMSVASALSALADLNRFFQDRVGDEYAQARALVPKLRRDLRRELDSSREQADIRRYFTK